MTRVSVLKSVQLISGASVADCKFLRLSSLSRKQCSFRALTRTRSTCKALTNFLQCSVKKKSFYVVFWAIAIPIPWHHCVRTRRLTDITGEFAFERYMRVQKSPPMFLVWQNCEVFVLSSTRPFNFIRRFQWGGPRGWAHSRWFCSNAHLFAINFSHLRMGAVDKYVENISIEKHYALTCTFLENCRSGTLADFYHDQRKQFVKTVIWTSIALYFTGWVSL